MSKSRDKSRYQPSSLNVVNFVALSGIRGVDYIETVMNKGSARDENDETEKELSWEDIQDNVLKSYWVVHNTNRNKNIAVFCVTNDLSKGSSKEASFYEQNQTPSLSDALARFHSYESRNKGRSINEVIIPIAESNRYSLWPLSYGRRHHYVTLHLNLDNKEATLYDSKGSVLDSFYDVSQIEKSLQKSLLGFASVELKTVYKGQQDLFNEYDCGAWSHEYTRRLISQGTLTGELRLDREKQKKSYEIHCGQGSYDIDHKQPSQQSRRYLKNAAMVLGIAALSVGLAVGIATLIYFTAGASIPFIVLAGAKVGISLGFLPGMSTLAASASIGAVGAGFVAAATSVIGGIGYGCKKIIDWCRQPVVTPKQEMPLSDRGEGKEDHSNHRRSRDTVQSAEITVYSYPTSGSNYHLKCKMNSKAKHEDDDFQIDTHAWQ